MTTWGADYRVVLTRCCWLLEHLQQNASEHPSGSRAVCPSALPPRSLCALPAPHVGFGLCWDPGALPCAFLFALLEQMSWGPHAKKVQVGAGTAQFSLPVMLWCVLFASVTRSNLRVARGRPPVGCRGAGRELDESGLLSWVGNDGEANYRPSILGVVHTVPLKIKSMLKQLAIESFNCFYYT